LTGRSGKMGWKLKKLTLKKGQHRGSDFIGIISMKKIIKKCPNDLRGLSYRLYKCIVPNSLDQQLPPVL